MNKQAIEEERQKQIFNYYANAIMVGFFIHGVVELLIMGTVIDDWFLPEIFSNEFIQFVFAVTVETAIFAKLYLWLKNKFMQRKLVNDN